MIWPSLGCSAERPVSLHRGKSAHVWNRTQASCLNLYVRFQISILTLCSNTSWCLLKEQTPIYTNFWEPRLPKIYCRLLFTIKEMTRTADRSMTKGEKKRTEHFICNLLEAEKKEFVLLHADLSATFLDTAAPGPLPVSSTARSHIPNQTFTHPRWRLSVTRSSREAERSFCSQVCHSCLASWRLVGFGWVNPWPQRGQGPRWQQGVVSGVRSMNALCEKLPSVRKKFRHTLKVCIKYASQINNLTAYMINNSRKAMQKKRNSKSSKIPNHTIGWGGLHLVTVGSFVYQHFQVRSDHIFL